MTCGVRSITILGEVPVAGQNESECIGALKKLIARVPSEAQKILVLSRSGVIVRYLYLPAIHDSEIRNMVALQLERHLPYSAREMYYDYSRVDGEKPGYSYVVLAAMSKREGDKIIALLAKCGISVDSMMVSSWILAAHFRESAYTEYTKAGEVLLVDVSGSHVELVIMRGKHILCTRSFTYADDLTLPSSHQTFTDQLIAEIKNTVDVVHKDMLPPSIKTVVLCRTLADVQMSLQDILGDTIRVGVFKQSVSLTQGELKCGSELVALGLLDVDSCRRVNLLPAEMRKEAALKNTKKARICALILFLTFLAVCMTTAMTHYLRRYYYVRNIESQLAQLDPEAQQVSTILSKMDVVDKVKAGQILPLNVIVELYEAFPANLYVTDLDYDVNKGVTIRGISDTMGKVSDLLLQLQKSSHFAYAEINFKKQKVVQGRELVDFEIDCLFGEGRQPR